MHNPLHLTQTPPDDAGPKAVSPEVLHVHLVDACEKGDLEKVRQILSTHMVDLNHQDAEALRTACWNNHVHIARYLVASPELSAHCDIHAFKSEIANNCGFQGHLDILKFILEYDLDGADIKDILSSSCYYGHESLVRHVLQEFTQSPEDYLYGGKKDLLVQAFRRGRQGIINFLLYDMNIAPPVDLSDLSQDKQPEMARQIAKRDFYFRLKADNCDGSEHSEYHGDGLTPEDPSQDKKPKI